MFTARKKRKENIAEYVIYLWQIEDLLRALNLDGDKIYETLVQPLEISEESKQDAFFWYMGTANLLKEENKQQAGHTSHSLHILRELNDVHLYLLKKDPQYLLYYDDAKGDIEAFKDKTGKPQSNEIETCFGALYSKLLLNMKKAEISVETTSAFNRITTLIAYLSAKFVKFERGEEAYEPDTI